IGDVAKLSNEQLVELQLHRNDWYVRQARQVLQERAAAKVDMTSAHAALKTMFGAQTDIPRRLRALWALYVSGGVNDQFAVKLLTDRNEHVRSWGVRLLVDDGVVSEKDRYTLERKAEVETSSLVRLYMASALQRLPVDQRGEIAALLAARKEDSDDHNIPLVIWYAIEPLVAKSHEWAIELGRRSEIPLVRQLIMRRVAEDIETRMPTVDQVLVTGMGRTKDRTADVVRGLADGLRGWRKAPEPAFWKQLQAISGSTDEETQKRIRDLSVVFGDGRALDELRQIAFNAMLDGEQRRAALRTVVESRPDDLLALLHRALGDRALVSVAARGLSQFDNADTPRLLLDRWNQFTAEDQRAALETLVSRAPYARALLDAVAAGKLRRQDLSAWHARQIRTLGDESLSKKLADVWGEVRETAEDKRKLLTQYREQLTPESLAKANLNNGREVYKKTCANCHTLFGEGGAIGPDLTGSNRRNLEYLLENMVDPSASVAADFRVSVLTMHDG
ncbi:MAG TPA: c-type cytochrome, partial [Pirellulaceae bacterium]|nr:c-type cytochrome [Pirellulaceae bacterium]